MIMRESGSQSRSGKVTLQHLCLLIRLERRWRNEQQKPFPIPIPHISIYEDAVSCTRLCCLGQRTGELSHLKTSGSNFSDGCSCEWMDLKSQR